MSTLWFGGSESDIDAEPFSRDEANAVAAHYLANRPVDSSPENAQEFGGLWSGHRKKVPTPDLAPGDTVYIEIDKAGKAILRQLLTVSSAPVRLCFWRPFTIRRWSIDWARIELARSRHCVC